MNQSERRKLIEKLKKETRENRKNKTFSVDPVLFEKFKAECEKQKIPMSTVLDHFMKDFVGGTE